MKLLRAVGGILHDAWKSTGGNYQRNFTLAGESGSIYTSQKTALVELVDGIIGIADEVGTGKIASPLTGNGGGAAPELEESRFSNNSKLDFEHNIESVQNIYMGDFNGHAGKGLTDIVAQKTLQWILPSKLKFKLRLMPFTIFPEHLQVPLRITEQK